MIEYKKLNEFERDTIYNLLKQAYSFDERFEKTFGESWKSEADDFFSDNPHIAEICVFITTLNDEPIGAVMWDPRKIPEEAEIGHNCIIPKYKGLGYGKEQMQEAINRILEQGTKKITVSTNIGLFPAQQMYEAVGFQEVRRESVEVFPNDWVFYEYQFKNRDTIEI